jgi:glycosyltransferase involved in cell wall biosynthesis
VNLLCLHQNFPGQYVHIARALTERGHKVVGIGGPTARAMKGIGFVQYKLKGGDIPVGHPFARRFTYDCVRADHALSAMRALKERGFVPDLVLGHSGWGETLFVKDAFPNARLITYCEFFYRADGADVGFDPEFPSDDLSTPPRLRARNAAMALSLLASERGMVPTQWQRSVHPPDLHDRLAVIHDGIDTDAARPDAEATFTLPGGKQAKAGDEILTYVARNMEPYRGFHTFMRALPEILARRPNVQVLMIGAESVSYGAAPKNFKTWREAMMAEVGDRIDKSRVHFLGQVPKPIFLKALQVSACHVYLTYPFVLSWSMLESMACGCALVASDTAPVREAIEDGVNGLLTGFFDIRGLADRVEAVLAEPAKYRPMREAARRTAVSRYDLPTVCLPQQLRLIDEVMAGPLRGTLA